MTQVERGLDAVTAGSSVVTIGNFDGVHRGHRTLLRRAVAAAHDLGVRSVAVTFDPHPAAVLRPGSKPPTLQPTDERIELLVATGVDLVVVVAFTRELSSLPPDVFVEQVLRDRLAAVRVIVGTNFRFGHRAAGDVVTLVEEGERIGFDVEAVTLLQLDGVPISSSAIRDRLQQGDVSWAARALGRPHRLRGRVVAGDGRGRTIGVPTANLAVVPGALVPADGVYAGWVELGDARVAGVTNVGVRPTFDGGERTVEAHLIDAEVELYGREITVTFEHRLRGERRFDGVGELVAQIRADIDEARHVLHPGREG